MVCSGEKTKLLVSGTRARRQLQIHTTPKVEVCGDSIEESRSEKLLGVIVMMASSKLCPKESACSFNSENTFLMITSDKRYQLCSRANFATA